MKNNKLLVISMSLLLSLGTLVGCKDKGGNNESVGKDDDRYIYIDEHNVATTGYEDVHVDSSTLYYQGVHDFKYTTSGKPFVKGGVTTYKLVIPEEATSIVTLARDEFTHFFKIATGIDIECILDKGMSYNKNDKYISLGQTSLLASSGLKINYDELTYDGVRIITKGSTIFAVGGSDYGTLHAVYDLLHLYFRYEQYSPDVYEIDKNVKNLVLYNFDVKDIPDVPHRAENYGFLIPGSGNYDQANYGYRMRMSKSRGAYFMPVYREFDYGSRSVLSTNTNTYVPYDLWADKHPKWFSDLCTSGKYQLCYTAHGDQEEYDALVNFVAEKIKFSMKRFTPDLYPDKSVITFTMEDNFNICNCEHCKAYERQYGAISSTLITFVNKVGKIIDEWQRLPENAYLFRENFQIIYFAYNGFVDAPITINADGSYSPSSPEMVLEKNTGVYLAIIDRCDFQNDFFNNPIHPGGVNQNMGTKETIDSWGALTNSIYLWLYQTNFGNYGYFFDTFAFYNQPMYNYISSKGLKMFFAQGQDTKESGSMGTNFNNLKAYLNAKLSWDSTLDQTTLINRYFKAMYGTAYKQMLNYFGLLRSQYRQTLEENWGTLVNPRSIYNGIAKREFQSFEALQGLIKEIDRARAIIETSEYNAAQRKIYLNNIEAEALYPLYATLQLYGDIELTYEDRINLAKRLAQDVIDLRIEGMATRENGGSLISDLPNDYLR